MRTSDEVIDYIMEIARQKEISQNELARMVDCPKSTLSRYVNHSRPFPINDIGAYSKALNVPVENLLGLKAVGDLDRVTYTLDIMISTGVLKTMADYSGKTKDLILQALEKDLQKLLQGNTQGQGE